MSRRRGQQTGYLWDNGVSWMLEYREDARNSAGEVVRVKRAERIAPARGPDRLTRREAERLAGERIREVDRNNCFPSSLMTVEQFVETKFKTNVLWKLKPAGRKHHEYLLPKVLTEMGGLRLCDVTSEHVEALVRDYYAKGFSTNTLHHLKYCVSAIFRHAKSLKLYMGENPAKEVGLPEQRRAKRRNTFTWDQAVRVIRILASPYREMAFLSMMTSMNVAEMCGLRWRRCNLTAGIVTVDGEVMAPYSIAVRENFYQGEYGTLKAGSRYRNVPLAPDLAEMLLKEIWAKSRYQGPDDPVFSTRNGTPVDADNARARHLKAAARKLGYPVEWHAFRRAHSTFAGESGLSAHDRAAMMGHSDVRMSLYYDVADTERRRKTAQYIFDRLTGMDKPEGGVQ